MSRRTKNGAQLISIALRLMRNWLIPLKQSYTALLNRPAKRSGTRLADLNEDEKAVIFACLKCVASGEVIKHDWEFSTIFGLEISEFMEVVNAWPNVDDTKEAVFLAINNSMNNLLGYPHGAHSSWEMFIPVSKERVLAVFQKWRGEVISGYFDGIS